ncbi:hypothetical protein NPIL_419081 [Nephila pilipes]|uniref:Uncharacterized protein n=1 Tax=Nephila pilipes TaxID=299642 RepID=A0A8X6TP86_NEPPI|nr:hypothetical protein NPIL_419081 [Nephila pilipes]
MNYSLFSVYFALRVCIARNKNDEASLFKLSFSYSRVIFQLSETFSAKIVWDCYSTRTTGSNKQRHQEKNFVSTQFFSSESRSTCNRYVGSGKKINFTIVV